MMLPILILLLVMALDFGRVFFAWVGVHNAARIAANYAAINPLEGDYSDPNDPNTQNYEATVLADAAAINCELPDPLPAPTFPTGTGPGDDSVVSLSCEFTPITPLATNLFGGSLEIGAAATFPIRTGIVGSPGGGGGGGGGESLCRTVPDLDGMVVADAEQAWTVAGFSGTFSFTGPSSNLVVEDSQVTNPGSVPGQCITFEATVSVDTVAPPTCPAGESLVPELTGLLVGQARDRWDDNGFDPDNFEPAAGSFDDQAVTDWTTSDPFDAGDCAPSDVTSVDVTYEDPPDPAPCEVPDFIGTNANNAQVTWDGAGFETTVQFSSTGNFKVGKQSINKEALVTCSSVILLEPGGGG